MSSVTYSHWDLCNDTTFSQFKSRVHVPLIRTFIHRETVWIPPILEIILTGILLRFELFFTQRNAVICGTRVREFISLSKTFFSRLLFFINSYWLRKHLIGKWHWYALCKIIKFYKSEYGGLLRNWGFHNYKKEN